MDRKNLKIIEERIRQGHEFHVIRVFDDNSGTLKRLVLDEKDSGELPEPLYEVTKLIKSEMAAPRLAANVKDMTYGVAGFTKVIAEGLRPKFKLVVFGAGHVGQAVGLIGALLGFDVIVIDDRSEFASRKRLPDPRINLVVGDYGKVIASLNLGSTSAVVIVTRGHQFDEVCLRAIVKSNAGYMGMIGSKRRVLSVISKLVKDGFAEADFKKLHAPIGLRIGARSPQEIAVAILAEIIEHFNGKNLRQETGSV